MTPRCTYAPVTAVVCCASLGPPSPCLSLQAHDGLAALAAVGWRARVDCGARLAARQQRPPGHGFCQVAKLVDSSWAKFVFGFGARGRTRGRGESRSSSPPPFFTSYTSALLKNFHTPAPRYGQGNSTNARETLMVSCGSPCSNPHTASSRPSLPLGLRSPRLARGPSLEEIGARTIKS